MTRDYSITPGPSLRETCPTSKTSGCVLHVGFSPHEPPASAVKDPGLAHGTSSPKHDRLVNPDKYGFFGPETTGINPNRPLPPHRHFRVSSVNAITCGRVAVSGWPQGHPESGRGTHHNERDDKKEGQPPAGAPLRDEPCREESQTDAQWGENPTPKTQSDVLDVGHVSRRLGPGVVL